MSGDKSYMVIDSGRGFLNIIDAESGNQMNVIHLCGHLMTPPMISGGTVSFTTVDPGGVRRGYVHTLPNGNIKHTFTQH